MALKPQAGRTFNLYKGAVADKDTTAILVGTVRTTGVSGSSENIEITNKASNNWREILPGEGVKSYSISIEGVWYSDDSVGDATLSPTETLQADFLDSSINPYFLENENGDAWHATWKISSFEASGDHNTELKFSATLDSSGEVSFSGNE